MYHIKMIEMVYLATNITERTEKLTASIGSRKQSEVILQKC